MESSRVSHYEIGGRIGRGGMGEVYEAHDVNARRRVAIKFVAPEMAADPDAFRRFESEAVNAAQMQHPHIAMLYEFEPQGERPFIAMELVAGPNLRERITQGPLPISEAVAVARDVASALAYAHRRDIVHRDIKPENLMFDEDGRIKVMDFGLARALQSTRLTIEGYTLGTAAYMSPESLSGDAGPPKDVFALGLVLVEMLSGKAVFPGDNPLQVMFAIANQEAPPLRSVRPDASEELEQITSRLLARDVAARMDAATAAKELARLSGMPLTTQELSPGPTPPAPPRRGERIGRILGIVSAVLILAGVRFAFPKLVTPRVSPERHQQAVATSNRAFEALQKGDLAAARSFATSAATLDPGYGEARLNLASVYMQSGQLDSAATAYDQLLRTHAKEPAIAYMAHYGLGDLNLTSGTYDLAVRHFRAAFALDSTRKEAFNGLGLALIQGGRATEGLAVLRRGLAQFPSEPALNKNAALASWKLGDATETIRYASLALAQSPGYASALGLRARARAKLGDRTGALSDWNAFVASNPRPSDDERAEVSQDLVAAGMPAEALGARSP